VYDGNAEQMTVPLPTQPTQTPDEASCLAQGSIVHKKDQHEPPF
jgi:hypothetical protein